MGHQNFRDLRDSTSGSSIPTADLSAITGTAETALWAVATYSPFTANQLQPQDVWSMQAYGVLTSAASSPGTLTVTPRFGTTTGGTSLGASAASSTLTTSKTNVPWFLDLTMTVRSVGATGSIVMCGRFQCDQVAINALNFGGPATTVDTTVAAGIFIGITLGSASDSMTPRSVHLWSEN
jgi:hypothetical protein